jgi:hypothetical protein
MDNLVKAFAAQSRACASLGAQFSARLLDHACADIAAGGITARLLSEWQDVSSEQLIRDAVALRLLASLHGLVLGGQAPELAGCYPPCGSDPDRAWGVAQAALTAHSSLVASMLAHEPQTNEVRRSACLLGGFLTIAEETGLPLRCFELGASAGLNSLWDRFRYQIGDESWGDGGSPVVLACRWEGPAPRLDLEAVVEERHACDRRPVDIRRLADATRLLSYCWAEQGERMARLRAAMTMAQASPVAVDAEDASRWIGQAGPKAGAATVVFHSLVWQYMPPAEQVAVSTALRSHAANATRDAPFYWLRMELNEAARQFELRLTSWQGWADRLLAVVHPHGEFALWR